MTRQVPQWLQAARDQWTHTGSERPPFAVEPGPGQESVWDYPRPPAIVADNRLVEVRGPAGMMIARSNESVRILETAAPPTFYLPPESVGADALVAVAGSSHCEWKGPAEYLALSADSDPVGWRYPQPYTEFAVLANWVSFYPARVECTVGGKLVRPQAGGFYGGWITDEIVGPFKGDPGTGSW